MKPVLAVDNGISGALAFLDGHGGINCIPMPIQKTRKGNEINVVEVWQFLKQCAFMEDDLVVVIEEPGGSKSAKAASSMSGSFHAIRALVEVIPLPLHRVTPQSWQRPLLKCKAGDTKKVALQMAKSLYPKYDFKANDKCRIDHGKYLPL